jgi:hypothetical protein
MAETETKRLFPPQPTEAELRSGLDQERLADLQRIAGVLKEKHASHAPPLGSRRKVELARERQIEEAIVAAATEFEVEPSTFRRRFGELARCADWKSTKPEDWLAGRETKRGGYRHGTPSAGRKKSLGGMVNDQTRSAYERAQEKLGCGFEKFIADAANHILSGGRFLTIDCQKESA